MNGDTKTQLLIEVDTLPDSKYPLRILKACRESENAEYAADYTPSVREVRQAASDRRAEVLDEAIVILERAKEERRNIMQLTKDKYPAGTRLILLEARLSFDAPNEFTILEWAPSGNWVKLCDNTRRDIYKFWVKPTDYKVGEVLPSVSKGG